MASECRKMCGDMGLPSKLGLADTAWAAARRTMCVAPKRVRRSLRAPTKTGSGLMMAEATLAQQGRQRSHQILRNRHDAVPAPFAVK